MQDQIVAPTEGPGAQPKAAKPKSSGGKSKPSGGGGPNSDNAAIAARLVAELPAGTFKARQAMDIIKRYWPTHDAAQGPGHCGKFLAGELWPFLKACGVRQVRQNSPRSYEIVKPT